LTPKVHQLHSRAFLLFSVLRRLSWECIESVTQPISSSLADLLPPRLAAQIAVYRWQRDRLGRSSSEIFKLVADGRPDLFLKCEIAGSFSELQDEFARAEWLAGQGIPCLTPLAFESHAGRHWLLTAAVPGRDLASATELAPGRRITILANALRQLHAVDPQTCPFDQRLEQCLARAAGRVAAGLVDEGDFDKERRGDTADGLLHRLQMQRPSDTDLVVAHGDASFPNVMAESGRFSGFVDLGRLGVADRYQDIALAVWSVRYNLGEIWVQAFLECYGISTADRQKLAYYKALDEFW
jgi:aminoglycoside 3'-phosphotransferase-2